MMNEVNVQKFLNLKNGSMGSNEQLSLVFVCFKFFTITSKNFTYQKLHVKTGNTSNLLSYFHTPAPAPSSDDLI